VTSFRHLFLGLRDGLCASLFPDKISCERSCRFYDRTPGSLRRRNQPGCTASHCRTEYHYICKCGNTEVRLLLVRSIQSHCGQHCPTVALRLRLEVRLLSCAVQCLLHWFTDLMPVSGVERELDWPKRASDLWLTGGWILPHHSYSSQLRVWPWDHISS
jgi:hypothetical protein